MNTVLILSPHLDDAAFSLGPLVAKFTKISRTVVATVFTKSCDQITGFALACQLDKGLSAEVDYMALRRAEDKIWCKKIGADYIHGPLLEAPHRGYQSAQALFGPFLAKDDIKTQLESWLINIIASIQPNVVFLPLGLGNHVDHRRVREVAELLLKEKYPLIFFKDQPYAAMSKDLLLSVFLEGIDNCVARTFVNHKACFECALVAVEAYASQIPFQFGGVALMQHFLSAAWSDKLTVYHTQKNHTALRFLNT